MSKHTPGPWKMRNRTGNHDWNNWRIAAEDGPGRVGGICRLDESLTGEESEANARLIAAAPELLEALDDCITNENATCIVQNDVAYMIRRFKAINQICRAAIAKATGEVS